MNAAVRDNRKATKESVRKCNLIKNKCNQPAVGDTAALLWLSKFYSFLHRVGRYSVYILSGYLKILGRKLLGKNSPA